MPKILILCTGGTIGMQASERGFVPLNNFVDILEERLSNYGDSQLPDYHIMQCDQLIDSANLQLIDWSMIADIVREAWHSYQGFVILHGTDTMAYSASALSFLFSQLDKPIIFTGSQIPLIQKRSDALINVAEALVLAAQYPVPEVCLYFNRKLLRGNRSTKEHSSSFAAFNSPNFPALAQLGIDVTLNYDQLIAAKPIQFQKVEFIDEAVAVLPLYPSFSPKMLEYIATQTPTKGLILQTFGAGNAPCGNLDFMRALEQLIGSGVSVINLTQCRQGMVNQTAYASGDALRQLGVIAGADLTTEAAYAKLHCLIGRGYSTEQIRRLLPQAHRGELTLF